MVLVKRDWWMIGIGFGIGFFIFTTIGREMVMTTAGMGKAEIKRVLAKAEKRTEKRAKPYD